ncbi:hypothetical protein SAMN05216553_108205 [Lentzea fradiae]|uniref:Uncharacterized protein n=1 Tax=Lentzea fradiae TaxID=200378 RepID=A0A1G7UHK0_9PSEU|nr:hypothetical protein [Lentzea fradiae]SDG46731.1 hypothetical protein SAMN05216553_108205 [Lentzea fradiae]
MKTIRASLLAVALFTASLTAPAHAAVSDHDLAFHWAPVHHQDTDSSDHDADYLSTVDFDGDWKTRDNWENQPQTAKLTGAAYYSVAETATHWFIIYAFYHPRDWDDQPDPFGTRTHENDLEGVLLAVRRDTGFGTLEAAVTVAHSDFYSYVPAGSPYRTGAETVDGTLLLVDGRPATWQEAKGHGLYRWDGKEFPGGDGVVYRPAATGGVPTSGNDRNVGYRLVDVLEPDGLWARRGNAETFASFGTFRGDNGKANAAHAPWGWDDKDDGPIYRGYLATDPALLVDRYFSNKGDFSLTYTRNAFR